MEILFRVQGQVFFFSKEAETFRIKEEEIQPTGFSEFFKRFHVNVYPLPTISCEGLPQSEDWLNEAH